MTANGRSLQLYFIDGRPDGMVTAEMFNWTGHVLRTPRIQIAKALGRPQSANTGIYLLFGEDGDEPMAYIGEAENMADRLKNHVANKDWWTSAVLVTTASDVLNKAHVKFLEARLVEISRWVARIKLENGNTPKRPGLTEADEANMEAFIDNLLMVLPAVGIDMFVQKAKQKPSAAPEVQSEDIEARFVLRSNKYGIEAVARLENGEFVVEAGSSAREGWISKASNHGYSVLRKELEASGALVASDGKLFVFQSDYAFNSPSAAAAVIQGRPANGTVEWLVEGSTKTYKEWEAQMLSTATEKQY